MITKDAGGGEGGVVICIELMIPCQGCQCLYAYNTKVNLSLREESSVCWPETLALLSVFHLLFLPFKESVFQVTWPPPPLSLLLPTTTPSCSHIPFQVQLIL